MSIDALNFEVIGETQSADNFIQVVSLTVFGNAVELIFENDRLRCRHRPSSAFMHLNFSK